VNQQFSAKDATQDGHVVNRGQMNTALALHALLSGTPTQKFWVQSAPGDANAAVPVSLLNEGLNKKANLNGNDSVDFYVRNNGDTNAAVSNARLAFVLGSYAALAGKDTQPFSVGLPSQYYHAVRLDTLNNALAAKADTSAFQSGSNGNGAWLKLQGGGQWCRQNLTIPAKTNVTWTYPAGFVAAPAVFITGINGSPAVWSTGVGPNNAGIYNNNDGALNVNLLAIW
jgi:hypothetical protein